MPPRIARPAGEQKEPSYQIGVSLDGTDSSALQRGHQHIHDRFEHEDTAQDHAAPPQSVNTTTEVTLPADFMPGDQPVSPMTRPLGPKAAPAPPQPRPAARSSRSSRRSATVATTGSAPPVSSRRNTAIDRSALQKALLWLGIGVLCAVVAVTVIIVYATHGSEDRRLGGEALAEAGRQSELVRTALSNHRGADARKAYEAALKRLTSTPQLGGAVAMPADGKPVVRDLAMRAHDLRSEIEALNDRITEVQNENAAAGNLAMLTTRFAKLSDPATDLDALERDVLAYVGNPVDPKAAASPANAQAFSRLVSDAKLRLASIVSEREARKAARSAVPLRLATVETDGLIQQEHFGEALEKLTDMATKNPDADFAPLRVQVEAAAERAWRSAKAQFDTRVADWHSPGATAGQRKAALAAAKERLDLVIQRFGMPLYVDQARQALAALP